MQGRTFLQAFYVLLVLQSLAITASALDTVTSLPGSFSAYTTLPWSRTMAYLAVRSPMVQPIDCENLVPGSLRKSYTQDSRGQHLRMVQVMRRGPEDLAVANGEIQMTVSDPRTHNIIAFYTIGLSPRTHHPSIIESDHGHHVHAFVLDGLQVLDVRWEMPGRTAWCEGTCQPVSFFFPAIS